MSIASQGTIISYAIQPGGRVGREGTFDPSALDWYRIRAPRVNIAPVSDQQVAPPELGGPLVPDGVFKQGYMVGGDMDVIPRLESSLGWLMLAVMGTASTVTGVNADGEAAAGVNTHIFRFDPDDHSLQPWMALRRMIPGATLAERLGETNFDCKVGMMRVTVPAAGKIAANVQIVGRDYVHEDPATWTYANDLESFDTTADAGAGYFRIGGEEFPLVGASFDFNSTLSTEQERIIGDYRLDNLIALNRTAQVRIVVKYENADLYREIMNGGSDNDTWSALPFQHITNGSLAFEARFDAPVTIGATAEPYSIRFRGNKIAWQPDGPLQLQAGNIITQTFVGTVIRPDAGDYLQIVLVNDTANYVVA
jgi:hypothetical protein